MQAPRTNDRNLLTGMVASPRSLTSAARLEVFGLGITQEGRGAQWFAGGILDEVLNGIFRPVPVHILAQPFEQRRELAAREFVFDARLLGEQRLVELTRDHRAERIRREIAERSDR